MMATIVAKWTKKVWMISRQGTGTHDSIGAVGSAAWTGRKRAWEMAKDLRGEGSPWDLEFCKATLGMPEEAIGNAIQMADICESALRDSAQPKTVRWSIPNFNRRDVRSVAVELARRGYPVQGRRGQSLMDRGGFVVTAAVAFAALIAHVVRAHQLRFLSDEAPIAEQSPRIALALHGEWSNRTRHLLEAIRPGGWPDLIVLLGRVRTAPGDIVNSWRARGIASIPPCVWPISARAAWRARRRLLSLLQQGYASAPQRLYVPPLREQVAIAFRVLLGAVSEQWWADHGPHQLCTAFFGHTGTADVSALERSMQSKGATTVHLVHGLTTGPNFVGFSNRAIFRCGLDAKKYSELHQYGACEILASAMRRSARAPAGIFLLTNLAHPMNPRFVASGPLDELGVLRTVATVARTLGVSGQPLFWKPHPAIVSLPSAVAALIRNEARNLGFTEIPHGESIVDKAKSVRWIVCTPSTVSVDLLAGGILSVVIDPQGTTLDTSMAFLPRSEHGENNLIEILRLLDDEVQYNTAFEQAWAAIMPARSLDLALLRTVSA